MKQYTPMQFDSLATYSVHDRHSKVTVDNFARPHKCGGTLHDFMHSLPDQFAGRDFPEFIDRVVAARKNDRPFLVGMGAHVIKVGLNPILIDLMERNIISGLALNGAGIIHDTEIAMVGRTSEEVDNVLGEGEFGAARETGEYINEAINRGADQGTGLGEAIGSYLCDRRFPHTDMSLIANAYKLGVPVTVHVAIGTDIIHIHPSADGAAIGKATHQDFKLFCAMVADLEGGVYMNAGSAVLLPEVFLKAITVVRNLGHRVNCFTTANFDFIRHYRSTTNVVCRPTAKGGRGFNFVGHHELMIPLFAAALLEHIESCANQ